MISNDRRKNFLLLQVNDALFPIGGYSHSYGLETYIQKDLVHSLDETWDFLYRRLLYGFCYNEFLSAKLAYMYADCQDLERIAGLEEILEACRVPRETREAGHKLGSRFIKTVRGMDIPYENDVFLRYADARKGKSAAHSIVYGVFCASVGISLEDAMEHFLYSQASSMVTNCVKTIPLSQTDGQHLLFKCEAVFDRILGILETLDEDDLCRSTPGFDIRCMQHEGLYSRIYMS